MSACVSADAHLDEETPISSRELTSCDTVQVGELSHRLTLFFITPEPAQRLRAELCNVRGVEPLTDFYAALEWVRAERAVRRAHPRVELCQIGEPAEWWAVDANDEEGVGLGIGAGSTEAAAWIDAAAYLTQILVVGEVSDPIVKRRDIVSPAGDVP